MSRTNYNTRSHSGHSGRMEEEQYSHQGMQSRQNLVQDQHFSNEIFYGLLSTLESLLLDR